MAKKMASQFSIQDIPEFQRLQDANPQDSTLDSLGAVMMYGRAIHWASILDIIWPDFETIDYKRIEIAYIVTNDPDDPAHFGFSDINPMGASMRDWMDIQMFTYLQNMGY